MYKKIVSLVLVVVMLMAVMVPSVAAAPVVDKSQITTKALSAIARVAVNGYDIGGNNNIGYFWVDANGRTQAPVRLLVEALKYDITYDKGVVTIPGGPNGDVKITIGKDEITVGGRVVKMDTIAATIDGRTYVPLRYVSEALGAKVEVSDFGTRKGATIIITSTFFPERKINGVIDVEFKNCKNVQKVVEKYKDNCYTGEGMIRLFYLNEDEVEMKLEMRSGGTTYIIDGLGFKEDADKQYEMVYALIDDVVEESSRQAIKNLLKEKREAYSNGWTPDVALSAVGIKWRDAHNNKTFRFGNVNVAFSNSTWSVTLSKAS